MEPKVNILLAVYNGEKYLKKQLDSLLAQTYHNIDIYIRDDGSTDGTVDFIRQYIAGHDTEKRMILLEPDGINLGCPGTFYAMARQCEPAVYYAFCDQDDMWYPDKISWAVERLEREDREEMLVYYTASDYTDEDGTLIRKSPVQKDRLELSDVLYYTPGSGFTIVFNEQARQKMILSCDPGKELHDRWMLRGAACFGKAIYDARSTAAHIRHEGAVTAGDSDNGSLIRHFVKEELLGPSARKEKHAIRYFYKTFRDSLTAEERQILALFGREHCSVGEWFKKVFYGKRLRQRLAGELALRILFLFGVI
ncbi:MAG: glycosyltransferase [Wujia sp.]